MQFLAVFPIFLGDFDIILQFLAVFSNLLILQSKASNTSRCLFIFCHHFAQKLLEFVRIFNTISYKNNSVCHFDSHF